MEIMYLVVSVCPLVCSSVCLSVDTLTAESFDSFDYPQVSSMENHYQSCVSVTIADAVDRILFRKKDKWTRRHALPRMFEKHFCVKSFCNGSVKVHKMCVIFF